MQLQVRKKFNHIFDSALTHSWAIYNRNRKFGRKYEGFAKAVIVFPFSLAIGLGLLVYSLIQDLLGGENQ